jgi:hypothetical protein
MRHLGSSSSAKPLVFLCFFGVLVGGIAEIQFIFQVLNLRRYKKAVMIFYLEKIHPFEVEKSAIQIKSFLVCFSKGVTKVEKSGFCLIGVSESKTQ